MSLPNSPAALGVHTLKTLCDELVSGRAIALDEEGNTFQFDSRGTRSIFQWYLENQTKWSKNSTKEDAEAIADQLDQEPPELPATAVAQAAGRGRIIHLKSIRAHRFAGIHSYGMPDAAPDDFHLDLERPLTSIEGGNAAGKTSILSAITWCLTGHVFRSQRPPEEVQEPLVVRSENDSEDTPTCDMTAITPKPSKEVLSSLGNKRLPLDTSVELCFIDDSGKPAGTIRRSLQRTPRGKIKVVSPDLSLLGLDPVALEVGTRMPGQIPYIQLGEACDLGLAVASLTGLRPLQQLAKHAEKTQKKLRKDLVDSRNEEIRGLDSEYSTRCAELKSVLENHPDIAPDFSVPTPGPEKEIDQDLAKCSQHFCALQAQGLAECKAILGDAFAPEDNAARRSLLADIGPALGSFDPNNIARLPSAQRLRNLEALTDEDISSAESLMNTLMRESTEVAKRAQQRDVAARLRLYARVAGWLKEHPEVSQSLENCPVCKTPLAGKTDEITGEAVAAHIERCLHTESSFLEKTIEGWERSALNTLRTGLPPALHAEMDRDLPEHPGKLISAAFGKELLQWEYFAGSLAPLKDAARSLCIQAEDALPVFAEPSVPELPTCFDKGPEGIEMAIRRVRRAVAFAKWCKTNAKACSDAYTQILGTRPQRKTPVSVLEPRTRARPLWDLLDALNEVVQGVEPITQALSKVTAMSESLGQRRKKEQRIKCYERAAAAIEPLLRLDQLVRSQVDPLVTKLHSATTQWKERLYTPTFVGAPQVVSTDVGADGALHIEAASDGTKASARQLSNTSDLRATLVAFLVAFWQHILEERGGLSLLLLDDPQELFDPTNRLRVADSIPLIVKNGGRVIVTTNDRAFEKRLAGSASKTIGPERHDRRTIHTLNPCRERIELGEFAEEIEKKRRAFKREENVNEDAPARDYAIHLRIYIESRLLDFFPTGDPGLPKQPSLSALLNAIRKGRNAGIEPYIEGAFGKMLAAQELADGSGFVDLMNRSHHGTSISYGEVWRERGAFVHVRKLVDDAHQEFELWLRRDVIAPANTQPEAPQPLTFPSFDVPLVANVAAFAGEGSAGAPLESGEHVTGNWLCNHALYVINVDNFGFAAERGCRAIVDLSGKGAEDHSLVVALHGKRTYARRLLRYDDNPGVVALESEPKNPVERRRSLLVPTQEVRLLEVVGILLPDSRHPPAPNGEAALVSDTGLLERVELACEVHGESALPVALPGQWVLGGRQILPNELEEIKGAVVAIATPDGSFFKRVGKAIPGAEHIRQFESIGGGGESMLVRTEEFEEVEHPLSGLPRLYSVRKVVGILYRK